MVANGGEVTALIGADTSGYEAGMNRVSSASSSAFGNVSSLASNIGKGMVVAGAATTAMGVTALKSFGTFEQSLNSAAVIAGGTSKDIQGLSDVATEMGATLPLNANEAAEAMVSMARDGASIATIKEEFPAIAQAATAAGSDLQQTASVVQQAMNLWGDSIGSSAQAAAVLTTTANVSNASVEEMQQVLADVGSSATSVGYSMQDVSTAVGLLTNKGIPAAQAAQNLNFAITKMIKPSASAQAMMDKLGVSYYDAQGKMKPINQVAGELSSSMSGLSDEQKQNALSVMFGQAGYKVMNDLMQSVSDTTGSTTTSWEGMSKAINDASSSSDAANKVLSDQASEMQKNMGAKIEQVGGNWDSLTKKALASKGGISGAILDMTNDTLSWAAKSKSPFAELTRGFIGLSPVIGPATMAVGGFLTSAGKIVGVLKGVGGLFASIGKSVVSLVTKAFSLAGSNAAVAASSAPAAAGEKAVGAAAKTSAKDMMMMGLAVLEIGAGIGLATAGMALLVLSITQLAKQGPMGVATLMAVTGAITLLVGVFAIAGPALTAGAIGMVAFGIAAAAVGAAVLMVGAGIALASAGISLLATQLPVISQYGITAAAGILALGGALGVFAAGSLAAGVGLAALTVGLLAATIGLTAGAVGMLALGVATGVFSAALLLAGTSIMIAAAGITLLSAALPLVAAGASAAGASMLLLVSGLTAVTALAIATTASLAALVVASAAVTIAIAASAVALGAFVIALGLTSAGIIILMAGLAGIKGSLSSISSSASSTAASLTAMVTSINVVKTGLDGMVASAKSTVSSFLSTFGNAVGQARANGNNLGTAVSNGVSSGLNNSTGQAKSAMNAMMNAIKDSGNNGVSAMRNIGNMIGQGLAVGMRSALGEVTSAANALVAQAEKAAQAKAKIHSPSRLMRDEVGYYIGAGMAVGMDGTAGMIAKSSSGLIEAAQQSVSDVRANGNITADASIGGVNGFNLANEVDPDVQNAPNSMINLTIEQNWDGNSVRYAIKSQDSRDEARLNIVNSGRS
ncbi:minor tail protein GP26-like protein [Weissella oryzae SG25]|uniref:Minor tail protein GP26-like protein n=1 Tax=Weissella oryzae (strain DSM 25784 / JCM 18191 / LMG 30913 / SG25) TaxID=1329250 RepID=A0A069D3M4_WEIOS|nr:phage tail tape measure protein [Weissella oryzae]GAK31996.1 minor tail protein GP26-like protein [Weissella oryzae SG25]